jgi:hypothetical protein
MSVVGGLDDFLEGDDVRAEIGEPTLQDLAAEVPGSAATPHVLGGDPHAGGLRCPDG